MSRSPRVLEARHRWKHRMAFEKLTVGVGCAGLVLASFSCRPSQSPPVKAPSSSVSTVATWTSPRFGYKWTLPAEWEFYSPNQIWQAPGKLKIDVVAARKKGLKRPSASLHVWDYGIQDRQKPWGSEADYEELEQWGIDMLEAHDIEHLGARRITMFGLGGVEVVGIQNGERLSLRMVRDNRRHFEVRCLSGFDEVDWPCESAFKTFAISKPPARLSPGEPRVLHLREPRFGLEFDAPDDSWLATGPHVGGGGAQLVWMWRQVDREVDVQIMDFRDLPMEMDAEQIVERARESFEEKGSKIVDGAAFLGGEPCHHLKVRGSDGWYRDFFTLNRNSINYSVLIAQRKRDAKLIARVTKALRFTLFDHERARQEASLARP
ncbi:MAG: hypothetical protein ABUL60_08575 [Myxococcales bacterium]